MNHWMILPILIPAVVAPLLVIAVRNDIVLARVFSIGCTIALLLVGAYQFGLASDGEIRTYALGNWSPPFGIVLVLDRLAATMLLLTAVIGFAVACTFATLACPGKAAQLSDNFGAATPITGFIDILVPNGQATAEPLEPNHADAPPNRSLWAIWRAGFTDRLCS